MDFSRISVMYFEVPQIQPPQIPRPAEAIDPPFPDASNVDIHGHNFDESPCEIALVPGIISPACSAAKLYYETMRHTKNKSTVWGSDSDVLIQKRLYSRLRRIEETLPIRFSLEHNFTPSTCFLRYVFKKSKRYMGGEDMI